MGGVLHRFLTGISVAVAVLALLCAWMTQSRVDRQANQLDRQRAVNWAISSALNEQRKLNAELSASLIQVMRQQGRASPTRYLSGR